jgi:GT2 family glycosyltransferase
MQPDMEGIEVLIVDNGSTDDSMRQVAALYDGAVRTLRTPENHGYTRGANIGIRHTHGRYIILLNNDTEPAPGFIQNLVAAAEADPRIGICCPKILSAKDTRKIDSVGHWVYPDGLSRCRGRFEEDCGQYDDPEDVLVPSGCAILVRREMMDDIGQLDEDFFSYCDDTDLGLRAQLRRWRCVTVPSAVVHHWGSPSSPLKAFLVERNRLWVAVKCLPLPFLLVTPIFTLLRFACLIAAVILHRGPAGRFVRGHATPWIPNGTVNDVGNADWLSRPGTPFALAAIFIRALIAGLRGLPTMWRKRRSIQRRREVSIWTILHWWRKYGLGPRAAAWVD